MNLQETCPIAVIESSKDGVRGGEDTLEECRLMSRYDPEAEFDALMERWQELTTLATGAWAEYRVLRDSVPRSDCRLSLAHGRWWAIENARRSLMREIADLEFSAAA